MKENVPPEKPKKDSVPDTPVPQQNESPRKRKLSEKIDSETAEKKRRQELFSNAPKKPPATALALYTRQNKVFFLNRNCE